MCHMNLHTMFHIIYEYIFAIMHDNVQFECIFAIMHDNVQFEYIFAIGIKSKHLTPNDKMLVNKWQRCYMLHTQFL